MHKRPPVQKMQNALARQIQTMPVEDLKVEDEKRTKHNVHTNLEMRALA